MRLVNATLRHLWVTIERATLAHYGNDITFLESQALKLSLSTHVVDSHLATVIAQCEVARRSLGNLLDYTCEAILSIVLGSCQELSNCCGYDSAGLLDSCSTLLRAIAGLEGNLSAAVATGVSASVEGYGGGAATGNVADREPALGCLRNLYAHAVALAGEVNSYVTALERNSCVLRIDALNLEK